MKAATDRNDVVRIKVWDLPTRIFHWALVTLIALQFATGKFGWLDMRWHFWFGYAMLGSIVFRVLWGFFGSQSSRFEHFVHGPPTVLRYLRAQWLGSARPSAGHNPLGGWSVLVMLFSVTLQVISGLFSSDGIDTDGPFAARVSATAVRWMTRIHHWNENALLALIALHVFAVLAYLLLRHENLIAPMLDGNKAINSAERPLQFASTWRALVLAIVATVLAIAIAWLGGI